MACSGCAAAEGELRRPRDDDLLAVDELAAATEQQQEPFQIAAQQVS